MISYFHLSPTESDKITLSRYNFGIVLGTSIKTKEAMTTASELKCELIQSNEIACAYPSVLEHTCAAYTKICDKNHIKYNKSQWAKYNQMRSQKQQQIYAANIRRITVDECGRDWLNGIKIWYSMDCMHTLFGQIKISEIIV